MGWRGAKKTQETIQRYRRRASAVRRFCLLAGGAVMLSGALTGCAAVARRQVARHSPGSPATPWVPPAEAAPSGTEAPAAPALPSYLLEAEASWTLEDIVDLALRNNPATRATWQASRAAAAHLGSEQGAYFPQIDAAANYSKTKSSLSSSLTFDRKSFEPSLALQYVLFDFGKRGADVEEARQQMYAANWTHNAAIQQTVLAVERAYYQYLYAKAVRQADSAAVKEAGASLDAAQERKKSGLATAADVLQARSHYSQTKLELQTVEGQIQTIRGSLATAMGLSPTVPYDIGLLPGDIPAVEVGETVEEYIRQAQLQRPDLAAARAAALGAQAHTRSVKAEGFPSLSVQGNISRRFYDSFSNYGDNYLAGVFLSVPLFTGFAHSYDMLEAQAKAEQAQQNYEVLKGQVDLDVWTSYYDLQTAAARLGTAREFLESATESEDVALERYKAGVGSILELLAAQTSLADARAQDLLARTDWFLALAELAYAMGRLEISPASPVPPQPQAPERDGR
jgi:outer membrane protein